MKKRKFYTIFILPHSHPRFRQIHLSRNFLAGVAAVAALIAVAGATVPHLALRLRAQSETLSRLREENRKLQDEKRHFEASLAELGGVIGTIEDRAKRIAKAAGLERVAAGYPSGGAGQKPVSPGDSLQTMLDEEMEALRIRSRNLEISFDQVDEVLRARERVLSSTPSGLPVDGFLSGGFGWRDDPFTGEREFHQGADIVAPHGAPIRASADGVITTAGRMSGYGRMIQISHGYGYSTRYGHLSQILVRPGQRVRKGDVIGRVGSSGRSTGPHLHYEIFKAGRRVNPYRYLEVRPS